MKSTYKLIGVFWDRKPIPKEKPFIIYDKNACKSDSAITLSSILTKEDNELRNLNPYQYDALFIDSVPDYSSTVLKFYAKRLLQIMEYYHLGCKCGDLTNIHLINKVFLSYYPES